MDIPSDRNDSKACRPGAILALAQTVRGMVGRLIGFFSLTEAERLKVGIFLGDMDEDR